MSEGRRRNKTKQDESKEKGGKIKLEINESKREN